MATTTSCCSAVLRPLRPPLVAAPHPPSPPSRFLPICSSSSKVPHTHLSRRLVSLSRVVFQFFSVDNGAKAGGILDEYVKKLTKKVAITVGVMHLRRDMEDMLKILLQVQIWEE